MSKRASLLHVGSTEVHQCRSNSYSSEIAAVVVIVAIRHVNNATSNLDERGSWIVFVGRTVFVLIISIISIY